MDPFVAGDPVDLDCTLETAGIEHGARLSIDVDASPGQLAEVEQVLKRLKVSAKKPGGSSPEP
jgi:hypothetical protein